MSNWTEIITPNDWPVWMGFVVSSYNIGSLFGTLFVPGV
jgi:hypothetical protein